MNRLKQLIKELCPNGVERKPLESLCTIITKQTGFDYSATIKPSLINEKREDTYSFIQNKDFNGLTINLDTDFYIPISVANRFPKITLDTPSILISLSGKVGNLGFYNLKKIAFIGGAVGICKLKPNVNGKYIMYFLQSKEGQRFLLGSVKAASHLNITVESIRKAPIPVPPMEVQAEIVKILDEYTESVTALQQELEAELTTRKKQYEYYRDLLLDFGVHGGVTSECEWRTLKEIAENCDSKRKPVTKSKRTSGIYPYYGASGIVDYVDNYLFDGDYLLISEDGANLLARSTPIAFSISGKNWVNNHAHVLHFDTYVTRRFVEIYLNSINLEKYISTAAQPKLTQDNLNKIPIPYPSMEKQTRIVSILDRFDKLCNDISEGLPAEIEARRKQFEYYRDKLLSFEEVRT